VEHGPRLRLRQHRDRPHQLLGLLTVLLRLIVDPALVFRPQLQPNEGPDQGPYDPYSGSERRNHRVHVGARSTLNPKQRECNKAPHHEYSYHHDYQTRSQDELLRIYLLRTRVNKGKKSRRPGGFGLLSS
jgi:hypothetical protein